MAFRLSFSRIAILDMCGRILNILVIPYGAFFAGIVHCGNPLIDLRLTLFCDLGNGGSRYVVREYHAL